MATTTLNLNLKIDGEHYAVITVDEHGFVDIPVNEDRGPLSRRYSAVKDAAERFANWLRTGDRDGVTGGTWDGGIELDLIR